jgi:hypothetical protein
MSDQASATRHPSVSIYMAPTSRPRTPRTNEPVTLGIPLPKGLSVDAATWGLTRPDGARVPLQTRILNRWSDGSIRWALLDFRADAGPTTGTLVELAFDRAAKIECAGPGIQVTEVPCGLKVDTGATQFELATGLAGMLLAVEHGGGPVLDGRRSGLRVVDAGGDACDVRWTSLAVEESGHLRTVVKAFGLATGPTLRLDLVSRLHFFAGSAVVRFDLTVRNPRRAAHPGGIWELGDPGSVLLRTVELELIRPATSAAETITLQTEPAQPLSSARERILVYQESSGGENWRSRSHVNRAGDSVLGSNGWTLAVDGSALTGLRASPIVVTARGSAVLGGAVRHFWQNFPKSIEATPHKLAIGFFPSQFPDVHEIQGGEQKTHTCWLLFGPDPVDANPLEWCLSPIVPHASPEWYAGSDAVAWLTPATSDPHASYLKLVGSALEGEGSFAAKRERADEYGWRDFGDIHADHEAAQAPDPADFVSHYNNQYDGINGLAIQFLRTGDVRWWTLMDDLARHVVDIDIYHTDEDKSAYNHGLFWHTYHYVDAGRSTHRSYPRAEKVWGGGPSAEHDYSTGLLHHYFVTGEEQSREAVLELARWVLDMDDGLKTVFRWLARGHTGLATATGSEAYHGPGRGGANSVLTLLNAHTLTGDRVYLQKAEQLIRRCVHPGDDIAALDLLDAERKWFYTVFLQALGRYLHLKAEHGELDAAYGYARASLVHFARWMADHEYPYLDKPEILEYPNETWAAQDMRKSEVFDLSAAHADGADRDRFRERSDFFFDYSTRTLLGMKTHTLTRPTVLMLSYGWAHAFFATKPRFTMPAPSGPISNWGPRDRFVPQKALAIRRAKMIAVGASAAVLLGAAAALLTLLF